MTGTYVRKEPTKEQIKAHQLRRIDSVMADIKRSVEWDMYDSAVRDATWLLNELLIPWQKNDWYVPDAEEINE